MKLIDAELVMEKVNECFDACDQLDVHFTALDVIDIIVNAPTVEAEPIVHGHWVTMSDADGFYYCCGNCGEDLPRYYTERPTWDNPFPDKESIDKTPRCPYCGAIME